MIVRRHPKLVSIFLTVCFLAGMAPMRTYAMRDLSTIQIIGGAAIAAACVKGYLYFSTQSKLNEIQELLEEKQRKATPVRFMTWEMQQWPTARDIEHNKVKVAQEINSHAGSKDFYVTKGADPKSERYHQIEQIINYEMRELIKHKEFLESLIGITDDNKISRDGFDKYEQRCRNALGIQQGKISELFEWTLQAENAMYNCPKMVGEADNEHRGEIITYSNNNNFSATQKRAIILWWRCLQRIERVSRMLEAYRRYVIRAAPAERVNVHDGNLNVAAEEPVQQSWLPDMSGWKWKVGGIVGSFAIIGLIIDKVTRG